MLKPQLKEFMRRLDKNSVAIIPAASEAVRSHDTNYRYRQNSDFFYLTGFEEPEAIAVIAPARDKKFTLFVRQRDLEKEIWNGYRAGVEGAVADYSADQAFPISEFEGKLPEILNGPEVLYYAFGHTTGEMDQKIIRELTNMRETNRKPLEPPRTIVDPSSILHEMRVIKSGDEVEVMQRAADIAAEAHVLAMRSTIPGMNESQIEAIIEHYFRMSGANGVAVVSSPHRERARHAQDHDGGPGAQVVNCPVAPGDHWRGPGWRRIASSVKRRTRTRQGFGAYEQNIVGIR